MEKSMERALMMKQYLQDTLGFEFQTTFWEEFSLSDRYGPEGVVEHYKLVFDQWKDNVKFLTELVLVLNLKIASWFCVDDDLGRTYEALWKMTDAYALDTLKGDDLHYYLNTLD